MDADIESRLLHAEFVYSIEASKLAPLPSALRDDGCSHDVARTIGPEYSLLLQETSVFQTQEVSEESIRTGANGITEILAHCWSMTSFTRHLSKSILLKECSAFQRRLGNDSCWGQAKAGVAVKGSLMSERYMWPMEIVRKTSSTWSTIPNGCLEAFWFSSVRESSKNQCGVSFASPCNSVLVDDDVSRRLCHYPRGNTEL